MGRRPKNWCQIGIVKAIKKAVPGFKHKLYLYCSPGSVRAW